MLRGGGIKVRPSIKRRFKGEFHIAEVRLRLAAIRSTAFGWMAGWFATKGGEGLSGGASNRRGYCEKNLSGTRPWIRIGNKMAGAGVVEEKHGCLSKAIATVQAHARQVIERNLDEVTKHTGLSRGTAMQILGSK